MCPRWADCTARRGGPPFRFNWVSPRQRVAGGPSFGFTSISARQWVGGWPNLSAEPYSEVAPSLSRSLRQGGDFDSTHSGEPQIKIPALSPQKARAGGPSFRFTCVSPRQRVPHPRVLCEGGYHRLRFLGGLADELRSVLPTLSPWNTKGWCAVCTNHGVRRRFFRPFGALTPIRWPTHDLRRGLHSFAASRLVRDYRLEPIAALCRFLSALVA